MNYLAIAQIIIGLSFFLFIPGYFLTRIFFQELKQFEKIMLSIVSSIMIGLTIGIFFGYDRAQAARTGGFTFDNIFVAEIIITLILAILFYFQRKYHFIKLHKKIPKPRNKKK